MSVFRATYSDWKLIRSRKVVQVVLELPIELSGHAYDVLGGMPNPASEVWVGVARLKNESEVVPTEHRTDNQSPAANNPRRTSETPPASADKPARAHRSWDEMTPAQQAGMLCADKSFQNFLVGSGDELRTKQEVRRMCGVKSRADILPNTPAGEKWRALVSDYRTWVKEPEYIG